MAGKLRLALLIDGDNVTPKVASPLLDEIDKLGSAGVRRVYGDWSKPNMGAWKDCALRYSLQPVQQFAYVSGKNATDIAMVIDAMDFLHSGRFDAFCLVSSDSDFTRLALRIREQGLKVFGFGAFTTPHPFVGACDHFIFLSSPEEVAKPVVEVAKPKVEIAKPKVAVVAKPPVVAKPAVAKPKEAVKPSPPAPVTKPLDRKLLSALKLAVAAAANDAGWSTLSATVTQLRTQIPDFKPTAYGFSQFGKLIESTGIYEVDRSQKKYKDVAVRLKNSR